jgi:hypothetical protein
MRLEGPAKKFTLRGPHDTVIGSQIISYQAPSAEVLNRQIVQINIAGQTIQRGKVRSLILQGRFLNNDDANVSANHRRNLGQHKGLRIKVTTDGNSHRTLPFLLAAV